MIYHVLKRPGLEEDRWTEAAIGGGGQAEVEVGSGARSEAGNEGEEEDCSWASARILIRFMPRSRRITRGSKSKSKVRYWDEGRVRVSDRFAEAASGREENHGGVHRDALKCHMVKGTRHFLHTRVLVSSSVRKCVVLGGVVSWSKGFAGGIRRRGRAVGSGDCQCGRGAARSNSFEGRRDRAATFLGELTCDTPGWRRRIAPD